MGKDNNLYNLPQATDRYGHTFRHQEKDGYYITTGESDHGPFTVRTPINAKSHSESEISYHGVTALNEDSGTTPDGHEYSIKKVGFGRWMLSFLMRGSNKPITREFKSKDQARNTLSTLLNNTNKKPVEQLDERFRILARIGRAAAAMRAKNAQRKKQKEEEEKKKKRKHLEDDELESMEDARDAMDKQKEDEEDEKEMKNLREVVSRRKKTDVTKYGLNPPMGVLGSDHENFAAAKKHEEEVKKHVQHFNNHGHETTTEVIKSRTHFITRIHHPSHPNSPYTDVKHEIPHPPQERIRITNESHIPKIKTPKVTNLYETYAKVYAKDKFGLDLQEANDENKLMSIDEFSDKIKKITKMHLKEAGLGSLYYENPIDRNAVDGQATANICGAKYGKKVGDETQYGLHVSHVWDNKKRWFSGNSLHSIEVGHWDNPENGYVSQSWNSSPPTNWRSLSHISDIIENHVKELKNKMIKGGVLKVQSTLQEKKKF
jgi:hypothetical protein